MPEVFRGCKRPCSSFHALQWFWPLLYAMHQGAKGAFVIPQLQLNAFASAARLEQSQYWVKAESLDAFFAARGLHEPGWVRRCPASCFENGGTCNLVDGTCACPPGRINDDAGASRCFDATLAVLMLLVIGSRPSTLVLHASHAIDAPLRLCINRL